MALEPSPPQTVSKTYKQGEFIAVSSAIESARCAVAIWLERSRSACRPEFVNQSKNDGSGLCSASIGSDGKEGRTAEMREFMR
jgi:hypothetical protein